MRIKRIILIQLIVLTAPINAQFDILFKSNFDYITRLNDTGISWQGLYPEGHTLSCDGNSGQDCSSGRDQYLNNPDNGVYGFDFTKLDANGEPLFDQFVSYDEVPWTCVRDNVTGLTWEVKTREAGEHYYLHFFRWGGLTAIGEFHPDRKGPYNRTTSWSNLVEDSNTIFFCGLNNWRVPSISELMGLINYDDLKKVPDGAPPQSALDNHYFPNSQASNAIWSASPVAENSEYAWAVNTREGRAVKGNRISPLKIRLVHD